MSEFLSLDRVGHRVNARMQTVWLSRDEVTAYGRDFVTRILAYEQPPEVWCAITLSGLELAKVWLPLFDKARPEYSKSVTLWMVGRDPRAPESSVVVKLDETDEKARQDFSSLRGKRILILDSAIHSGDTFSAVHRRVSAEQPAAVISYSLIVKRSSSFYPTYWGCCVQDADRAFFLLDSIPNNRLSSGSNRQQATADWSMRRLAESDCERPAVMCGLESIDRVSWSDRHYAMLTSVEGLSTYLCEVGPDIAGFAQFHFRGRDVLVVDEIAVHQKFGNRGIGGMILRFVETYARQSSCRDIRLWAISDKVPWYTKYKYKEIPGASAIKHGNDVFKPMHKVGLFRSFSLED